VIAGFLTLGLLWQSVSPEAVEHAKAGLEARQKGNLTQAIAEFRKVAQLAPDFDVGYANLGAALLEDHRYSDAIEPLKKALSLNVSLPNGEQMLGDALLSSGYVNEALPHLKKAGDKGALGIAQLKLAQFQEAIQNLTAALEKHPNDATLLYYLGQASGLLSKQAFDTLESAHPDSEQAHQSLAENYVALRKLADAEREYAAAVRARSDMPGLHLAFGEMYLVKPDLEKAEAEFRMETKLEPGDAEAAYHLGDVLLKEGKGAEAVIELKRADQLRQEMPETLYSLGKAESLVGDNSGAELRWKKVIELEGKSDLAAQAHFGLATLYRKQGKQAEAAREMSEYESLKHGPQQP
jgi:tetratricopeptide (TPR) repeat protein